MSCRPCMVMMLPCASTTCWWIPSPSTMISATRLQFTPSGPCPMMASATIPTWLSVSMNQAWSSLSFFALLRPALPLLPAPSLAILFMMDATSWSVLHSVTVTFSGSFTVSRQFSFVIRSVIVVPNSGSGTRQTVPKTRWSSGSPVASLSSSPAIVIVTVGSQCLSSLSCAQIRNMASLLSPELVSTLSFRPYWFSFLLR